MNKNLLRMWVLLLIMLFSGSIFWPIHVFASENRGLNKAPLDNVIAQARKLQLGEQKAWLNLLHYKSTLLGERQSQADDASFFLATDGATNAQAELEADLRAFYNFKTSAHPRCLFPARFHWLNSKLNFSADLPVMDCVKFNQWKDKIQADQVTLLFPGMFLDNPASMFGHTFLRFDRVDKNDLLSYTLNYAADYDESDPMLVYSWKGITGGYQGVFFIQAYFKTLRRYNDIEQRDIWEYPLNLNKQEVEQLLRHVWEVKSTQFDYFFFRENCSYRLLALLDVAREDINMSIDSHPIYAVPVDTVRDIKKAGLISSHHYRPSAHNKITQMVSKMGDEATQLAISMADVSNNEASMQEKLSGYDTQQQAKVLLLANEMLNQNKEISAAEEKRQLEILSARSALAVNAQEVKFNFTATPPELAHESVRWNISAGVKEFNGLDDESLDNESFYEIGFRPAFHDLLDDSTGFMNGASISALETELRWYQRQEKFKLQSLNFFSLQSIVPVKSWMKFGKIPSSKSISFKLKQRDINENQQILEFESQFSLGYAAQLSNVLFYGLAKTQLEYAGELNKNHAFYIGGNFGGLWSFDASGILGKAAVSYQYLSQISGEEGDVKKLKMGLQFNLIKDQALKLEYEIINYELFDVDEIKLNYYMYF